MFFVQIALNSLISGTHILLLAWALYLIHTVTRTIHVAVGAIAITGGYGYYFLSHMGIPIWLSILGGIGISVVFQLLSFWLLKRFFYEDRRFIALLGSLAFGTTLESIIAISFGSSGKFLAMDVLPTFEFVGLHITFVGIWTLIIGGIIALFVPIFIYVLPYGRVLRAIAGHHETAQSIGIHDRRIQIVIFIIVGIICGIIGILKGFQENITPMAGLLPTVTAFLALIVGGMDDFRGIIIASYLLVLVPALIVSIDYMGTNISSSWSLVFVFAISLIILVIRPKGLFALSVRNS